MRSLCSFLLLCALALFACAPRPQDCVRADVYCAGLVTDFGTIREGINQEAWFGLQDAKAAGLVDRIDYIETTDSRDRAANIAALAANGYDVIVTAGSSISNETTAAAQKYPKILFIGVEQPRITPCAPLADGSLADGSLAEGGSRCAAAILPNITRLVFHEDRSGFLSGALAALMTQTNRIGAVCEVRFVDAMRRYCDGFQAGALYVRPDVKVTLAYRTDSAEDLFNDPVWGETTASQLVNQGADVVFAAGGSTADAALEAAASEGAYVIGTETDVYARLPDVRPTLLTSAMNDVRSGTLDLIRLARQGQFPAGEFVSSVSLASFHEFEREIPQSIKDRLIVLQKGLADGSIQTGIPYESP